jgi:hypothetical protein
MPTTICFENHRIFGQEIIVYLKDGNKIRFAGLFLSDEARAHMLIGDYDKLSEVPRITVSSVKDVPLKEIEKISYRDSKGDWQAIK